MTVRFKILDFVGFQLIMNRLQLIFELVELFLFFLDALYLELTLMLAHSL